MTRASRSLNLQEDLRLGFLSEAAVCVLDLCPFILNSASINL